MILVDDIFVWTTPEGDTPNARRARYHARRNAGRWAHLSCDVDDDLEELHAFAQAIGLRRDWFCGAGRRFPHYDLTPGMRAKAVRHGAVAVTAREFVLRCRRKSTKAATDH